MQMYTTGCFIVLHLVEYFFKGYLYVVKQLAPSLQTWRKFKLVCATKLKIELLHFIFYQQKPFLLLIIFVIG